ncbi:MAG TPA: hypothetical protein VJA94_11890 [Candidatus Angelobacter sp.]
MDWMPTINEHSQKGCDLVIGIIVAAGMAAMFAVGVPGGPPLLCSVPLALVIALGLRYWHNRHKVDVITLVQPEDKHGNTIHSR